MALLSSTTSVCPICLKALAASLQSYGQQVYLIKECPDHGLFQTIIWQGPPDFTAWRRHKIPAKLPDLPPPVKGCPFDCGLCSQHGQKTCTVLLEITHECNLKCPVCFHEAGADGLPEPAYNLLQKRLQTLIKQTGAANLQFSGGEPTLRQDLLPLISEAKRVGFPFVQLNTNGLKISEQPDYALQLFEAGLDSVYLQFDAPEADAIISLRGRDIFAAKERAIANCQKAGLPVVLVATLAKGINDHLLGKLLSYGLQKSPAIKGIHLQPLSFFGRYTNFSPEHHRLTLPEVMQQLAAQSQGMLQLSDFHPPGCEHSRCSFNVTLAKNKSWQAGARPNDCCPPLQTTIESLSPISALEGADRAIAFVRRHWSEAKSAVESAQEDDLDRFLRHEQQKFTISAMAFQDAWTLETERLRGCCIHTASLDGRLIPFCAWNISAQNGRTLYRPRKQD